MPTFIQLFYCSNCKKNVSTFNGKNCKICGSTVKKKAGRCDFECKIWGKPFIKGWVVLKQNKKPTKHISIFCMILALWQKLPTFLTVLLKAIFKTANLKMQKAPFMKKGTFFHVLSIHFLKEKIWICFQNLII